jgi:hypothetical protein
MAQIRTDGQWQGDIVTLLTNAQTMATEFKADFNASLTKLDNDGTIVATNFSSTWAISATVPSIGNVRKDGIHQGELFSLLSDLATFAAACKTAMDGLQAKLDADATVNTTTYASGNPTIAAPATTGMSSLGMDWNLQFTFLSTVVAFFNNIKTGYNAVLTKLDSDTGVADVNYNSTNATSTADLSLTV